MSIALNNALSGLRVAQQSLNVLSQNIANANNADYTRQTLNQQSVSLGNEVGSGVDIASIDRQINSYITRSIVAGSSSVAQADVINNYYTQLQVFIGQPGKNNSIDTYVNTFFNSMSQLSTNPETASLKTTALAAGQNLATQVSGLASNVNTLRYYADGQIKESVDSVNSALKNIYNLNVAVLSAKNNNQSVNALKDSLDVSLKSIAEQMNVTYRTEQDGTVSVSTSSGLQLVGNGNLSELDYTPSTSVDDFNNNIPSGAVKVYQLDATLKRQGNGQAIVTAGTSDQVTTSIESGKIAGLLAVRDKTLPDVLKQLDNLASQVINTVNAVHNDGSGYPPLQTLTGTTMINPNDSRTWNGKVMIAALTATGDPILSPYTSDSSKQNGLQPLTIDLASLNSGQGKGNPTFQTVIDQINHYYGAPQPRAHLGNISNIQLVANSDSLVAGTGTFDFALNLSSLAATDTTFRVTGAAINGGATINTPPGTVTVNAGDTKNTTGSLDFSVNMAAAGPGPYTVTLNVQSTAADGTVSNGVVTYTLTNAPSALRNDTYGATTATGSATLESPNSTHAIMTAKLVDAKGIEIAKDPSTGNYLSSGFLQISGADSTYRVAISELDSADKGDPKFTPAANSTGFGFSHYFGLNNFFADTGKVQNSALHMAVSKSIAANPQLISLGKLTLSTQPTDTNFKRYTYSIGSGSNQSVSALSALGNSSIKFLAAGGLSETQLAFSDYAAQILGDAAAKTTSSADSLKQQQLIQQGFVDKDKSVRGVNIDEEMANTILFQNAYSANARVITVTKQLFDDLLAVFQ